MCKLITIFHDFWCDILLIIYLLMKICPIKKSKYSINISHWLWKLTFVLLFLKHIEIGKRERDQLEHTRFYTFKYRSMQIEPSEMMPVGSYPLLLGICHCAHVWGGSPFVLLFRAWTIHFLFNSLMTHFRLLRWIWFCDAAKSSLALSLMIKVDDPVS